MRSKLQKRPSQGMVVIYRVKGSSAPKFPNESRRYGSPRSWSGDGWRKCWTAGDVDRRYVDGVDHGIPKAIGMNIDPGDRGSSSGSSFVCVFFFRLGGVGEDRTERSVEGYDFFSHSLEFSCTICCVLSHPDACCYIIFHCAPAGLSSVVVCVFPPLSVGKLKNFSVP